jgi:hypothetical protein
MCTGLFISYRRSDSQGFEDDKRIAALEEPGDRTLVDRLMSPFNRAATKKFLKEGQHKVWGNARILSTARRRGSDVYVEQLAALQTLCRARVADLVTPRYVIMHLARRGFRVVLPPLPANQDATR